MVGVDEHEEEAGEGAEPACRVCRRRWLNLPFENSSPDFPKGPEVKTLCSHCRGHGFAPWLGRTKTPHASQCGCCGNLTAVNEGGRRGEHVEAGRGGRWWRPDQWIDCRFWEVADKVGEEGWLGV